MEIFSQDQLIEAQQNTQLRIQIVEQFKQNGYLVLSNVQNSKQIYFQMNQFIQQLPVGSEDQEMVYAGIGIQQKDGNIIYMNNSFPLQYHELIKKALNLQDDESPDILKKIDLDDEKNIQKYEYEFSVTSRQLFGYLLKLIDLQRTYDLQKNGDEKENQVNEKQTNEKLLKSNLLEESLQKSEVQKTKSILQSGKVQKIQRYSSPDFGLGSIILLENSDNQDNQEGIYLKTGDGKEVKLNTNNQDIVITCGEYLNKITDGLIKNLEYSIQLNPKQDQNSIIHQQFLYPNLAYDPSSQEQINPNNNLNHQQAMKKPNFIASSFLGTCALKMKVQSSNWAINHHNQMIGHQAIDYLQTLSQEELYPQIKVTEQKFKKNNYPIRCFHFNLIDSTMNIAKFWKKTYVNNNSSYAFIADQQFKGQGQNKNTWTSPKGNCYVTFLTKYEPSLCYCLSQLTAISVVETLDHYMPDSKTDKRPVLKWINDIFMNEKKISGVLCRIEDEYIIIGIGVNINHNPIEIAGSTCLKEELGLDKDIDIFEFVQKLWQNLSKNLQLVKEWNTFNAILSKVETRMKYLNEKVKIYDLTLTKVLKEGIFRGLNEFGNALLENLNDQSQAEAIFEGRMRPF